MIMRYLLIFMTVFAAFFCRAQEEADSAAADLSELMAGDIEKQNNITQLEDWSFVLARLESQITRAEQVMDGYRSNYLKYGRDFIQFSRYVEQQADELRFLLSISPPGDVFEITLHCQQIDELYGAFQKRYRVLLSIRDAAEMLITRTANIERELNAMRSDPQYVKYADQLKLCADKYSSFQARARKIIKTVDSFIDSDLVKSLDSLAEQAAAERTEIIDNVFFSRRKSYSELLPNQKEIFVYWFYTYMDMKEVARNLPSGNTLIWFTAIFGVLFGIFLFIGPKWIYPWLLRYAMFPDKYRKSRLFFGAGLLITLALTFYLFQYRAALSSSSQLHQFSQTLGACALLMLALAFRMERDMMRRCLRFYFPFFIQNLLASLMFIWVMSYQLLMLFTVPLNIIILLWALWLMRKGPYPVFDRVVGWIAIVAVALETLIAASGFLYIGFTMMLSGFVVLGLFQAAVAISRIILSKIDQEPQKLVTNMMLYHLVLPLLWLAGAGVIVSNISITYHLKGWLEHWVDKDIKIHNLLSFSMNDVLTIVIVLLVLIFLISLAKLIIFNIYKNSKDLGMVSSFVTLGTYIAWTLFVIFVLLICQVQYSSLLVILGGFSVGIGFALKEVLENFISGIILLIGQQVRPGDEIEFDGIYARVNTVSFRATVIETFDGSIITLPNTNVLSKDFRNWTRKGWRMRRDFHVGVSYDADLKLVRRTMLDAAAATPAVFTSPEPEVYCTELNDSSIDFVLRFWLRAGEQTSVMSQLRENVVMLFRERGIEIPFNQLDVTVSSDNPGKE